MKIYEIINQITDNNEIATLRDIESLSLIDYSSLKGKSTTCGINGGVYVINQTPQDILQLFTWLLGQEKHTQEELTSLRKKVEKQQQSRRDPYMPSPVLLRTDKENQKIVDELILHHKNSHSSDHNLRSFVEKIIKTATCKDIKDL